MNLVRLSITSGIIFFRILDCIAFVTTPRLGSEFGGLCRPKYEVYRYAPGQFVQHNADVCLLRSEPAGRRPILGICLHTHQDMTAKR
jgi:hypothetical protein